MQALEHLREWAENRAVETITWYLRDKRTKRLASRLLRAAAVIFAVAGGVLPLLSGSTQGINPNLGYAFLAVAAGCVAFDHFFGLSSGWMRDIATVQALQGRLTRFHYEWASWLAARAGAITPAPAEGEGSVPAQSQDSVAVAMELINGLISDMVELTEAETAQWIADFSSSVAALRQQANPGVTSPQDLITWTQRGDLTPK